jgi:predicted acylesterase/phospholipase RssA
MSSFSFVVATRENNSQAAILRSYKNPRWTDLLYDECRVWEACRATSAAPTFFAPIQIGKYNQGFIDGAAVANNPIQIAYSEARNMWPGRDPFILSIGTGSAPGLPFKGNLRAIVESMKKIVTETERTAEAFYNDHTDLVAKKLLFRFNVTYGLSDIGLQDYKEVDRMADATQTYLDQGEVGKKLSTCVSRLSACIPKGNTSSTISTPPKMVAGHDPLPTNPLVISKSKMRLIS